MKYQGNVPHAIREYHTELVEQAKKKQKNAQEKLLLMDRWVTDIRMPEAYGLLNAFITQDHEWVTLFNHYFNAYCLLDHIPTLKELALLEPKLCKEIEETARQLSTLLKEFSVLSSGLSFCVPEVLKNQEEHLETNKIWRWCGPAFSILGPACQNPCTDSTKIYSILEQIAASVGDAKEATYRDPATKFFFSAMSMRGLNKKKLFIRLVVSLLIQQSSFILNRNIKKSIAIIVTVSGDLDGEATYDEVRKIVAEMR